MLHNYKLYKGAWIFSKAPNLESKLKTTCCNQLLSRGG